MLVSRFLDSVALVMELRVAKLFVKFGLWSCRLLIKLVKFGFLCMFL